MQSSRTILFPTDLAFHSQAAFEHAVHLAKDRNCRILALHVANQPDMCGSRLGGPSYHEDLRQRLDEFTSDAVDVECRLHVADPGPEICRVASSEACELIFMGITSKSGIDEMGFGSVHEYVVQHACCPVITLCQQPIACGSNSAPAY